MKRMMLDQGPDPRVHPEAPGCCEQEPVCRPTGQYVLSKDEMEALWEDGYGAGEDEMRGARAESFREWAKENGLV